MSIKVNHQLNSQKVRLCVVLDYKHVLRSDMRIIDMESATYDKD